MMRIALKRATEPPARSDGRRILVDRLWPRGRSKEALALDYWAKEVAPSTDLRRWFGHDPARWAEFKARYFRELDANPDAVRDLRERIEGHRVTFVFAAADERHNNAVALRDYLTGS